MDYTNRQKVRMEKISESNDSYEKGYWVEGYLLSQPVTPDKCVVVFRISRNGVNFPGLFNTSKVQEIRHEFDGSLTLATQNSVWHLQYLDD